MVQSRHTIYNRTYDLIARDWDRTPPKPVVEGERVYEGIEDDLAYNDPDAKLIQPADVRRVAYCSVFAGASGCAYGHHEFWNYRSSAGARARIRASARAFPSTRAFSGRRETRCSISAIR
jgi:Protein of unknown function (DUF4038)